MCMCVPVYVHTHLFIYCIHSFCIYAHTLWNEVRMNKNAKNKSENKIRVYF